MPIFPLEVRVKNPRRWENAAKLATHCATEVLQRSGLPGLTLSRPEHLAYIVQKTEDLIAEHVLGGIRAGGTAAWEALAEDIVDDTVGALQIARRWATPTYPESWQWVFWRWYVPAGHPTRAALVSALRRRIMQGGAPPSCEKRVVCLVCRRDEAWVVSDTRLVPVEPGDFNVVQITGEHDG